MILKTYIKAVAELFNTVLNKVYKIENSNFVIDKNKNIDNGDFFTNIAMLSAKPLKKNPIEIASEIIEAIKDEKQYLVTNLQVAKPGYINFDVHPLYKQRLLNLILKEKSGFGQFAPKDIFYNIEFVSANPTGLLHIGHARNAALGATLANVWQKYGIRVEKEYLVNDAGNQINTLGIAVLIRYMQLFNKDIELPQDSYHASEIIDVAKQLKDEYGDIFLNLEIKDNKVNDNDALELIKDFAVEKMLDLIKKDLALLRISFDLFYSERDSYKNNLIPQTLKRIEKYSYTKDGATWLRTTDFGDDKDRVMVKSDGTFTYFLPDIVYHNIKYTRHNNMTKMFNIWGADHKSYVDRVTISLKCLGHKDDILHVIILQMIRLTKNGQEFKMSKRTGNSLTLRDLVNTIGVDSARWVLVSQTAATQIEIDVDKFNKQTHDNNLYYVLYAYARICQLLNKVNFEADCQVNWNLLTNPKEKELINNLIFYPTVIESISSSYEANKLNNFLFQLSQVLHSYYNEIKIKDEKDLELKKARCALFACVKDTIKSGLHLLDIEPSEKI
ncbi:MAG: arginine--tRNA ligase [Malacoplasma sp.]|nr:arginine--tRNA ligase [Malacoplasma sp.]